MLFFPVPIIYFEQSVYKVNESVGHVLVAVASAEERVANVTFSIITTNNSATCKGNGYSSL